MQKRKTRENETERGLINCGTHTHTHTHTHLYWCTNHRILVSGLGKLRYKEG